jgi:hypothetical protein
MTEKKKPSVVGLLFEGIESLVDVSHQIIKNDQGSFEDYINGRASELDDYIKRQESEGLLTYVAGEVQLTIDEKEDQFFLLAEFYFKDASDNWIKKTIKGESLKIRWAFSSEWEDQLKNKKKISFDYERP